MAGVVGLIWVVTLGIICFATFGNIDYRISALECKVGIHTEHHILQEWVLRAMNDTVECKP